MLPKSSKLNKRNLYIFLIFSVFFFGAFLRFYKFKTNLFFELDQSRDYRIVYEVLENGLKELPLLGPRAGGTFFRLGPIYNYFQIAIAAVFGLSPVIIALPDLFFSILTIPLLFLFLRLYFPKEISLITTFLFSISLFAIEFSRFAWNPNSVPFFTLMCFYS
ncbi:MAG: hypothetical protein GF347_03105, partial [Candidatus Moranbacteria bacterium]|nr:hypothetical protein [Candidatus Moranbacteria bacterium]